MQKLQFDLQKFRSIPQTRGLLADGNGKSCAVGKFIISCGEMIEKHHIGTDSSAARIRDILPWELKQEIFRLNDRGDFEQANDVLIQYLIESNCVEIVNAEQEVREVAKV